MLEDVTERYLDIRDLATGDVVTALEVLSPTNKRPGQGRQVYEAKRRQVLGSLTNLVEIDLLRTGAPMAMVGNVVDSDYRILVSASPQRPGPTSMPFQYAIHCSIYRFPCAPTMLPSGWISRLFLPESISEAAISAA